MGYKRSALNENKCPEGSKPILDEEECKKAAEINQYKSSHPWDTIPKGCLTYVGGKFDKQVFFNTHETGAPWNETQLICKTFDMFEELPNNTVSHSCNKDTEMFSTVNIAEEPQYSWSLDDPGYAFDLKNWK